LLGMYVGAMFVICDSLFSAPNYINC
jgi:hypothetical protein